MNRLELLRKINLLKYLYLNYFCKSVERKNHARIIPYKHSVIEFEKGSRIIVSGDIEIGTNLIKGSKAETRVRLRKNAIWNAEECCSLSYGTTLEVLDNGVLNTKYFTMNCNCTMIVASKIEIGHDVMIGRNVTIYDSDYHQIVNSLGKVLNNPKPVLIGNHVWLGTNSIVLKGSIVGKNSIVSAFAVVSGKVEPNVQYIPEIPKREIAVDGIWKREGFTFE